MDREKVALKDTERMAKDVQEEAKECAQSKGQGRKELEGRRSDHNCQLQKYQMITVATIVLFYY